MYLSNCEVKLHGMNPSAHLIYVCGSICMYEISHKLHKERDRGF